MSWPRVVERLQRGEEVVLHPKGQSMTPRIYSGQRVTLTPVSEDPEVGDIVLAKVHGRYYLHLVSSRDGDRYQISNNHGHVNGWTSREKIYAVVEAS